MDDVRCVFGRESCGCRVGPQYARPAAPLAPEFKEALLRTSNRMGGKVAQPSDAKLKGDWWTLFNDPQLNELETQIDPANQTLKEAEANFRAARAAVRFYRASMAPTIGTNPSIGALRNSRTSHTSTKQFTNSTLAIFTCLSIEL